MKGGDNTPQVVGRDDAPRLTLTGRCGRKAVVSPAGKTGRGGQDGVPYRLVAMAKKASGYRAVVPHAVQDESRKGALINPAFAGANAVELVGRSHYNQGSYNARVLDGPIR